MEKINLIFFNVTEELQIVSELNHYYKTKQDYEVEFIKNSAEVSQYVMSSGNNGVIIFTIQGKTDLQNAVDFLRANKKLIKRGLVKPACIIQVKNKKVEKILEKYGCQDILDASTLSKTFSFKIDFWAKNIKSIISKAQKDKELKLRAQENKGRGGPEGNTDKKEDFKYTQALNLHSDTWLIKSKSDHKKILRRYLLRVLGPSPHVGQWHELERKEGDSMATWKYVIRNVEEQQFVLDEGAWYFTGSKPEFDWKINRWNFSSDAPHLYFYTEDRQIMSRFKYNEGIVEVAENSNFAKAKEEMILETCDVKFSFDKDKADDSSENIEKDEKVDQIDGKLDGKVDEDEEARNDMLEGKSKDGEGDQGGSLKGKIGSSDNDSEADEKKKSKFEEDDLGGNYGGKSKKASDDFDEVDEDEITKKKKIQLDIEKEGLEPEAIDEGDLGGQYGGKKSQVEEDDEVEVEITKKKKIQLEKERDGLDDDTYEEDDLGGNYVGKSSTDEIDDDNLRGMINAVKKKAQDKKEHDGYDEGDVGGNYGGKGSTDEIDDDPLSGLIKKKKNDKKKDKAHDRHDEGDVGGHYGGKGSTDEIDNSPLGAKLKKQKEEEKKNRKSKFNEDDLGGHYDNDGDTDELDRSPLKGKLGKKQEEDQDIDDLSRDMLEKLKAKKEALKQAGLSDEEVEAELEKEKLKAEAKKSKEDYDVDELSRDMLDKLKAKKEALKQAGLSDEEVEAELEKEKEKLKAEAKKSKEDYDVDELSRDMLEKLKAKIEALKKAGLSDEDLSVDELPHDEIEEIKKKREEVLKKTGLLEEGDDIAELASSRPIDPEKIKKKVKEDLAVDELARDLIKKQEKKKEALKKAGLLDEDLNVEELPKDELEEIKAKRKEVLEKAGLLEEDDDLDELTAIKRLDTNKAKAIAKAKLLKDNYDVDELSRDMLEKLKTKKEALKKAGLSDEDHNVEELSREDKEALTTRRKEVLEKAGLLEEDDNVDEVEDLLKKVVAKKEKQKAKQKDNLDVDEEDRDSDDENIEDLMSKVIKASTVEAKSGKDLYGDKVGKKPEVERDNLENDMLDTLNKKGKFKVEIDPEELLDEQFNLKEIFSNDPGVSTESGELKVTLEEKDSNVTYICNFEDFYESEIVVISKDENIAVEGKEFNVKITLNYNGSNVVIVEDAKVIEVEDYIEGEKLVSLEFENIIDEKMFETFNILYQERQESIKDFMNLARGYYDEDEA